MVYKKEKFPFSITRNLFYLHFCVKFILKAVEPFEGLFYYSPLLLAVAAIFISDFTRLDGVK